MANKKDLSKLGRAFEDLIQQARNKQNLLQTEIQEINKNPAGYFGPETARKQSLLEDELGKLLQERQQLKSAEMANIQAQNEMNEMHGADDLFGNSLSVGDAAVMNVMSDTDSLMAASIGSDYDSNLIRQDAVMEQILDRQAILPSNRLITSKKAQTKTQMERIKTRISGASLSNSLFQGIYKKANTTENKIAAIAAVRKGVSTSKIDNTTASLEEEYRTLNKDRAEYGEAFFDEIVNDPKSSAAQYMQELQDRESVLTKKIGFQDVLKTTQHQMGMTTGQIITGTQHRADVASARMTSNPMFNTDTEDKGSWENAKKDLVTAATEFTSAVAEMNKAIDLGADNVEDLSNAAKSAADNFDSASGTERALRDFRSEKLGGLSRKLGFAGAALSTFGDSYTYGAVTSEQTQMNLRIQYAEASNQQYNDIIASSGGDGASIRRILRGAYSESIKHGESQGNDAVVGAGFKLAGQIVTTAAQGVAGYAVGGPLGAAAGILGGVGGISNTTADLARGNVRGAAEITGHNQGIGLGNAKNHISDYLITRGFQYSSGMGLGTRGAGVTNRGSLLGLSKDTNFINEMAGLGVSADEMPTLFAQASGAFGSDLSAVTTGMKAAATQTQRGYFGSTGEALQAAGSLAGVGGVDMASVLKEAVATGMDASKHIQEMVSGITGLSRQSMLYGVDTSESVSNVLSRSNHALGAAGFGVNQRNAMSQHAFQAVEGMFRDDSLTIQNLGALELLNQGMSDAKMIDKQTLMTLGVGEVANVRGASSASDLNDVFSKLGINFNVTDDNFGSVQESISQAYKHKAFSKTADINLYTDSATKAAYEIHMGNLSGKERQAVLDKYGTNADAVKDANTTRARNSNISKKALDSIAGSDGSGADDITWPGKDTEPGSNINNSEKTLRLNAQQQAKVLTDSLGQFSRVAGEIGTVADALATLYKDTDSSVFAEQAKDAADNMQLGSKAIDKASSSAVKIIKTFEESLSNMIKQMKSDKSSSKVVSPSEYHNVPSFNTSASDLESMTGWQKP